jgi:EmrB/QacA subfamily drug resistance transporter
LAPSLEVFIAARGLQGVGGALLVPTGLATLNAVAAPERRGQLLGTWGMFSPLITALGPVVGGWLTDTFSWRSVFLLNVPFGLVAIWLARRSMPESRDGREHDSALDWAGLVTLMIGLGGLIFGLIEGPNWGWGSPGVIVAFTAGLLGLTGFVWAERRHPDPLIPLGLFRTWSFTNITLVTLFLYLALSSVFFFQTLHLQQIMGMTAAQAGLAVLPVPLSIFLMSRVSGGLIGRFGARTLLAVGIVGVTVGFIALSLPGIGADYWRNILPANLIFGLGLGLIVVPITSLALSSLPNQFSGIASGTNNAASRIAQMLAVAVFGSLMLTTFQQELRAGTADLALTESQRSALLADSRNLGATVAPGDVDPQIAADIQTEVRLAFLDAYHLVLYLSAGLGLASLFLLLLDRRTAAPAPVAQPMVEAG